MEWPEPLEENLPPPYRGEPPNLRGDILDEIADHLTCAMDREREHGNDDVTARRIVLDKFGHPRKSSASFGLKL